MTCADLDASRPHAARRTLEHVEPGALSNIVVEARRLVRPGGVAAHLVDPSDHFAHQDLSKINFLRFGEGKWARIAGNLFAYCNRLRAPDYVQVFEAAGFSVARLDRTVDQASLRELNDGFPLDPAFREYDHRDLCTTSLDVYAIRSL